MTIAATMDKKYTAISEQDIVILQRNGCRASDWSQVFISDDFNASRVMNAFFKGEVRIGALNADVDCEDGIRRECGIWSAHLNHVTIGDYCVIKNVSGWISNVIIDANVIIENVGDIVCTGPSSFGNGEEIEVLNEGGGRELKITTHTSAQIAYMTVLYRDQERLVAKLNQLAEQQAQFVKSSMAAIGQSAHIRNCQELQNVNLGPFAVVNGAQSLKNGTVDSSQEAATTVGHGVMAENFIFQKGSSVKDGAMIAKCLVGEGSKIGKQFSAENSVFFANSEGFHSEAVALFAGPYSVTHHRSTLLIAAMTSFYNAGSGTNQSNHMYKLGPLHQGILERGCKTGSSSYLLWPSRVGAFTAVIGKHYANFDTSDLPFSYINDDHGRSVIIPGMNFFTVGTLRDGEKWPNRDRRKSRDKLDLINFEVLSPFTGQKMIRGQKILMDLYEASEKGQEYVSYQGIQIKRLLLKTCRRYYKLALEKYFGDIVMKRISEKSPKAIRDLFHQDPHGWHGDSEWIDVSGLLCVKPRMEAVMTAIRDDQVKSYEALHAQLKGMHSVYDADEWNWFLVHYAQMFGKSIAEASDDALKQFLVNWKDSSLKLLNMVAGDAKKEFEGNVRLGFGIDGGQDADFEAVRGTFDDNKFVKTLHKNMDEIQKQFEDAQSLIS